MNKALVLVIDDEVNIRRYVSACLRKEGYEAVTAGDGQEGLLRAEEGNPALVILDIRMPGMNGFEVCRRLREWTQSPIIMLSAIGDEKDKIKCLDLGADDYITKPFNRDELLARVRAVLRRTEAAVPEVRPSFNSGELQISFAERSVRMSGTEIKLTPTEYNLLQELVLNSGKVMTYDHLLHKIWGPEYREEREYVHTFIKRLRTKLHIASDKLIVNVAGVGYQFKDAAS